MNFWRLAAILITLTGSVSAAHAADRTLVFAAASMKDAVEALARAYGEQTGQSIIVSFASSGTLARQIEAGAPADIYIAANPDWMEYLARNERTVPGSRDNLVGNTLVAVASTEGERDPALLETEAMLQADRLAMGDPNHVPAGIYARQALTDLGLWADLQPKAVFGENVRVSLALAARGEVDYAIVYGSDAMMDDGVDVIYTFPTDTHEPIAYTAALMPQADAAAERFLEYLFSKAAEDVFVSFGFTILPGGDS